MGEDLWNPEQEIWASSQRMKTNVDSIYFVLFQSESWK